MEGFSKIIEGGYTDLLTVECCGNVVEDLGGCGTTMSSQTARVQNAGVTGSGWSQGHGLVVMKAPSPGL